MAACFEEFVSCGWNNTLILGNVERGHNKDTVAPYPNSKEPCFAPVSSNAGKVYQNRDAWTSMTQASNKHR